MRNENKLLSKRREGNENKSDGEAVGQLLHTEPADGGSLKEKGEARESGVTE